MEKNIRETEASNDLSQDFENICTAFFAEKTLFYLDATKQILFYYRGLSLDSQRSNSWEEEAEGEEAKGTKP